MLTTHRRTHVNVFFSIFPLSAITTPDRYFILFQQLMSTKYLNSIHKDKLFIFMLLQKSCLFHIHAQLVKQRCDLKDFDIYVHFNVLLRVDNFYIETDFLIFLFLIVYNVPDYFISFGAYILSTVPFQRRGERNYKRTCTTRSNCVYCKNTMV